MSRLSKKDREQAEVAFFGPLIRRVLKALDNAEARERDLKARLEVAKKWHDGKYRFDDKVFIKLVHAALDLRNKKWRKP